jgi:hypothetical protein
MPYLTQSTFTQIELTVQGTVTQPEEAKRCFSVRHVEMFLHVRAVQAFQKRKAQKYRKASWVCVVHTCNPSLGHKVRPCFKKNTEHGSLHL